MQKREREKKQELRHRVIEPWLEHMTSGNPPSYQGLSLLEPIVGVTLLIIPLNQVDLVRCLLKLIDDSWFDKGPTDYPPVNPNAYRLYRHTIWPWSPSTLTCKCHFGPFLTMFFSNDRVHLVLAGASSRSILP